MDSLGVTERCTNGAVEPVLTEKRLAVAEAVYTTVMMTPRSASTCEAMAGMRLPDHLVSCCQNSDAIVRTVKQSSNHGMPSSA